MTIARKSIPTVDPIRPPFSSICYNARVENEASFLTSNIEQHMVRLSAERFCCPNDVVALTPKPTNDASVRIFIGQELHASIVSSMLMTAAL